jgi:hypothetical protein
MAGRRRMGDVERAARRELRGLGAGVRSGPLAQAVLYLAQRLDGRDTCGECEEAHPALSARDEATIVHELRVSLAALAAMSPERAEGDKIDELTARREARLAADR